MQILLYWYGGQLKLENDGFCGGRKNLRTQRNSLGARRELMANSTHGMATGPPSHIGGRRALSPLPQSCGLNGIKCRKESVYYSYLFHYFSRQVWRCSNRPFR